MSILVAEHKRLLEIVKNASVRFRSGDSFRVFHGRGACYPGLEWLTIDFFRPALLLTVYGAPPQGQLEVILDTFAREPGESVFDSDLSCVLVQRRDLKQYALKCLVGEFPNPFFAQRGHLRFYLLREQQNVGYFLDIEPARQWLEACVQEKSVLNLFSFTCSFSVLALAAGARSVINVDMNRNALNTGRENHRINNLNMSEVQFLAHDILRSWGKLIRRGPYDIVLVDPPSRQRGSFVALKDYVKVIRKLPELLCEGGLVLLCLNAPEVSCAEFQALIDTCDVPLVPVQKLEASADFPDKRESSLTMLVYRLETGLVIPPL